MRQWPTQLRICVLVAAFVVLPLIPCAKAQIPISGCGQNITVSGSYYLTNDLACAPTQTAISVSVPDVEIDGRYHTIIGNLEGNYSSVGISSYKPGLRVKNLTIRDTSTGINLLSGHIQRVAFRNVLTAVGAGGFTQPRPAVVIEDSLFAGYGGIGYYNAIITARRNVFEGGRDVLEHPYYYTNQTKPVLEDNLFSHQLRSSLVSFNNAPGIVNVGELAQTTLSLTDSNGAPVPVAQASVEAFPSRPVNVQIQNNQVSASAVFDVPGYVGLLFTVKDQDNNTYKTFKRILVGPTTTTATRYYWDGSNPIWGQTGKYGTGADTKGLGLNPPT